MCCAGSHIADGVQGAAALPFQYSSQTRSNESREIRHQVAESVNEDYGKRFLFVPR